MTYEELFLEGYYDALNEIEEDSYDEYEAYNEEDLEEAYLEGYYAALNETSQYNKQEHNKVLAREWRKQMKAGNVHEGRKIEALMHPGKMSKEKGKSYRGLTKGRLIHNKGVNPSTKGKYITSATIDGKSVNPNSAGMHDMLGSSVKYYGGQPSRATFTTSDGTEHRYYTNKGKYVQTKNGLKKKDF